MMGLLKPTMRLAFGTQYVSSFLNHVLASSSCRIMRGATAGSLTSFFFFFFLVGLFWFLWGRCSAGIRSLEVMLYALRISDMKSDGIGSTVYLVPYHFSFLSHRPGMSRDTMVRRKLSGRKYSRHCLMSPGSNFRSLLPLSTHSRGRGSCMMALVLLQNNQKTKNNQNKKTTTNKPFCSSKIHSCGGISRRRETYWKKTLAISL